MSNPTPTLEPTTINASRALRMIQDAVKTRSPEYNYKLDPERFHDGVTDSAKACVYARNGAADCLVGVALHLEGVPVKILEQLEAEVDAFVDEEEEHDCGIDECAGKDNHSTGIADRWFLDRLRALSGFELTPEAVDVLSAAQVYQDTARTWGEAETAARKTKEQGFREPLPNGAFG